MSAPLSLVRRPFAWWTRFWFDEVDARVLGLMRITIGVIALWTHITLFPELTHVLGQNAELFSSSAHGHWTTWSLYDAIGDPDELHRIHTLLILPYVLFILGIGGRASTIAMFVVLASLHHGNTWMLNAGDRLTRLSVFTCSSCPHPLVGGRLGMRKLGRPLRAVVPMTTHRLVQIQLAWMYMATGIAKGMGRTGTAGRRCTTRSTSRSSSFPDLVSPNSSPPGRSTRSPSRARGHSVLGAALPAAHAVRPTHRRAGARRVHPQRHRADDGGELLLRHAVLPRLYRPAAAVAV